MTDINDVQAAMRLWHETHTAVMDFYEAHNVLEPDKFAEWTALRDVEDNMRGQADKLIGQAHSHPRSEEHTSELQSLMRISYAVFCLKKKKHTTRKKSTKTNSQIQN